MYTAFKNRKNEVQYAVYRSFAAAKLCGLYIYLISGRHYVTQEWLILRDNNICKFNISESGNIVCGRFVLETRNSQAVPGFCEEHIIGIIISGEALLTVNRCGNELRRGDIFIVRKGEIFSVETVDKLEYIYICFHGRRADELLERVGISGQSCVFKGYGFLTGFWVDSIQKSENNNLDLFSESVVLYTLAHLNAEQKPKCDRMTQILKIIDESFTEPEFSLSSLAERIGYNVKYLSSLFKKEQGVHFSQYLRDLRLKHAVFLIEQGIVSVKNIAILSGFGDALYFSKIFKQVYGVPPKKYIENLFNTAMQEK